MTHEQKPESAEFRTQKWDGLPENQANDGWHWLTHEITNSPTPYLWKASSNVWIGDSGLQFYPNSAWCARRQYIGRARAPAEEMAEQRREDAEGAEPVKWQRDNPGNGWIDTPVEDLPFYRERGFPIRPLYTRPANVAALEARVKELEGAINAACERLSAPAWTICSSTHCERASECRSPGECGGTGKPSALRILQAAAIREGGEHG